MEWASVATTVALEMVAPILVGYWLDQRWKTGVVFVACGAAIGLGVGMWSLIRIARNRRQDNEPDQKRRP